MIDLPVGSNSLEESEVLSLLGFLSGGWSLPMLLVLNRESTTTWGYKKNLAQQPQHLSIMCGHILHGSLHNLHAGEASEGITVTHKTNNCSLHHWEHCCLKSSKCMTHGECVYCIIWQRERERKRAREDVEPQCRGGPEKRRSERRCHKARLSLQPWEAVCMASYTGPNCERPLFCSQWKAVMGRP